MLAKPRSARSLPASCTNPNGTASGRSSSGAAARSRSVAATSAHDPLLPWGRSGRAGQLPAAYDDRRWDRC